MLVTSGYKVEILKLHTPLRRTMEVSRRAVSWLEPVIDGEWDVLSAIEGEKRRFNAAEQLIHSARGRKAKYGFDREFPKMPSYLRRAILQHVIGGSIFPGIQAAGELREAPGRKRKRESPAGLTICLSFIRTTCTVKKRTGYT